MLLRNNLNGTYKRKERRIMKKRFIALATIFLMVFSVLPLETINSTVYAAEIENSAVEENFSEVIVSDSVMEDDSIASEGSIDSESSEATDELVENGALEESDSRNNNLPNSEDGETDYTIDNNEIDTFKVDGLTPVNNQDVSISTATEYYPITEEEIQNQIQNDSSSEASENIFNGIDTDQNVNYSLYVAPERLGDDNNETRYTVLVLDTSDTAGFENNGVLFYTADTALPYVKQAAKSFLKSIKKAPGKNYVAIVSYKDKAKVASGFTDDIDSLETIVDDLTSSSNVRDMSAGIDKAYQLLSDVANEEAIRNTVLFTTGMTNNGSYSYSGHYSESTIASNWRRMDNSIRLYAYANSAYAKAASLKQISNLYTLGLFQTMDSMPSQGREVAAFFRLTAKDIATSPEYFYAVTDPNNLEIAFGDISDKILGEFEKITFHYDGGEAVCYYGDKYFEKSPYEYDPQNDVSLATMTMALAMSAFGSNSKSYTDKSENAKDLLMKIGIPEDQIRTNSWFKVKPTTDSIACIAGNKIISNENGTFTLIPVAIRGGGYEREWASNFTIGKNGQHDGFETARDNVLSFLKAYIKEMNITGPVKFWVTGYSRAAATANLVSGALDDGVSFDADITYDKDDVYAFCFEAPAGALSKKTRGTNKYNNIFNIINLSDPVPYVAPGAWKFSRYGKDYYLPSPATTVNFNEKQRNMLDIYYEMKDEYTVDDFIMKKIYVKGPHFKDAPHWWERKLCLFDAGLEDDEDSPFDQGTFLSNYVTILAKDFIGNRNNYVDIYQDEIREICSVFFGCSEEQSKKLTDSIVSQAKDHWKDFLLSYLWNAGINPWGSEDDAFQIVSDWLNTAIKNAGITDFSSSTVDAAGKDLADLFLALITNHPNYFSTAVMNIKGIGGAHYPELCYAWLASMDKNFQYENTVSLNNGTYRVIRINCDVDVTVKDASGNTVASIVNERPQEIDESNILSGINENGEKIVILPTEAEYDISIVGREADTVDYGISEYSATATDYTRIINYFDIEVEAGESIESEIPAYSELELDPGYSAASSVDYNVINPDGEEETPDSDLKDEQAAIAYHTVTVTSDDKGATTGSGTYQYGSFAELVAIPAEEYQFFGWYIDNECVSDEAEYRIRVDRDIDIKAVFIESDLGDVISSDIPEDGEIPDGIWVAGVKAMDYTGNKITQKIRVYDNCTLLSENKDYTVSYKNNTNAFVWAENVGLPEAKIDAKAPQIVLKMKGNYTGTQKVYFDINAIDITADDDFIVDNISVPYTGKKQTPKPSVSWKGKELSYGKDYYVSQYESNKRSKSLYKGLKYGVSTYNITVVGKNNYVGTKSITLTVVGKQKSSSKSSLSQVIMSKVKNNSIPAQTYQPDGVTLDNLVDKKGNPLSLILKYKNKTLIEGVDYSIVGIQGNDAVGTAKIIIRGLQASSSSTGFSFAGEKYVTFPIVGRDLSKAKVIGMKDSYTFTGTYITPLAALEGIDSDNYEVTYSDNLLPGTAKVKFSGQDECSGTKVATFKITKYPISGESITINDNTPISAEYAKGGAKPVLSVKYKNIELREGIDYTLSYKNNKNINIENSSIKPEVKISGLGEFTGSRTENFTIKKKSFLNGMRVDANDVVFGSKKDWFKTDVKVYDSDGSLLKKGVDYENDIKFFDETINSYLGDSVLPEINDVIRVEIEGKGSYTGTIETKYRILEPAKSISSMTIKIKDQEYTGKGIYITNMDQIAQDKGENYIAYIKTGKQITYLELGKDFIIGEDSYTNNVTCGKATATVQGIGEYGGSKKISFTIKNKSINKWWCGLLSK